MQLQPWSYSNSLLKTRYPRIFWEKCFMIILIFCGTTCIRIKIIKEKWLKSSKIAQHQMCFAMAQAGYKKDSEVRRKRNFLLFLVTYIYSLFYTHLLDMHVCKKMVLSIKFGLFLWATQYPIHLFLSLKSMY